MSFCLKNYSINSAIAQASSAANFSRFFLYASTSSSEVQKHTSSIIDCGVRCNIANLLCGVSDSDFMHRRGMSRALEVVCARREANRSSSFVASSATIASVPRALGLEWALKWRSITKSNAVGVSEHRQGCKPLISVFPSPSNPEGVTESCFVMVCSDALSSSISTTSPYLLVNISAIRFRSQIFSAPSSNWVAAH